MFANPRIVPASAFPRDVAFPHRAQGFDGAWQRVWAALDALAPGSLRRRARTRLPGGVEARLGALLPAVWLRGDGGDQAAEGWAEPVADVARGSVSTVALNVVQQSTFRCCSNISA